MAVTTTACYCPADLQSIVFWWVALFPHIRLVGGGVFARGGLRFFIGSAGNPIVSVQPCPEVDQFAAFRTEREELRQPRSVFTRQTHTTFADRARELEVLPRLALVHLVPVFHATASLHAPTHGQPQTGCGIARRHDSLPLPSI